MLCHIYLCARHRYGYPDGAVPSISRIRAMTSATEVITELGASADLARTKAAIVEAGRHALGTDLIALFTIDPCLGSIECESSPGVSEQMKTAFLSLYEHQMTDRNVKDTWICDPTWPDATHRRSPELLSAGVEAVAACPIRSHSSICGAIVAFYTDPLPRPEETVLLLEVLKAHAATALSYAASLEQSQNLLDGLYGRNQELSHQATVDGLTGLPNHRTFRQTLKQFCRKSLAKQGRPLSLVMVDVDHFKAYNDAHGHPEGDSVLRDVARIMASEMRQGDFAARYGGEEFALLFSGADKESACTAAERIRKEIAQHTFHKGSVTVSMGVAEFPLDTSDPGELIELADRALYHAKAIGRNRVYGWGTATPASVSASSDCPGSSQAASILVVETTDESCATEVVASMPDSCDVMSVGTLEEAVELLRSRPFDIAVVTSNVLPERDTHHLASLASLHVHMPIILIADGLPAAESRDALRRGASDIVMKPYNPASFPVLIERNLERKRLELQRLMQKSTGVMLQAIEALVSAVDAKDHHTAGHSHRVTELAMSLSDMLGISDEERYALELAAKLHDIGKLGLPDSALNKESALTESEWQAMREHPVLGAKIVGTINELAYVSTIIRHHHERLDGSGYPDGLRGPAIPYLARIIAVADTYEALTTERAHRKSVTPAEAIAELKRGSGTLYEPHIVDVLEKQLREQEIPPARFDAEAA